MGGSWGVQVLQVPERARLGLPEPALPPPNAPRSRQTPAPGRIGAASACPTLSRRPDWAGRGAHGALWGFRPPLWRPLRRPHSARVSPIQRQRRLRRQGKRGDARAPMGLSSPIGRVASLPPSVQPHGIRHPFACGQPARSGGHHTLPSIPPCPVARPGSLPAGPARTAEWYLAARCADGRAAD
jgi:hypothetical protein